MRVPFSLEGVTSGSGSPHADMCIRCTGKLIKATQSAGVDVRLPRSRQQRQARHIAKWRTRARAMERRFTVAGVLHDVWRHRISENDFDE